MKLIGAGISKSDVINERAIITNREITKIRRIKKGAIYSRKNCIKTFIFSILPNYIRFFSTD